MAPAHAGASTRRAAAATSACWLLSRVRTRLGAKDARNTYPAVYASLRSPRAANRLGRYRMDFAALINHHRARGADVTIATHPADEEHAHSLGILRVSA